MCSLFSMIPFQFWISHLPRVPAVSQHPPKSHVSCGSAQYSICVRCGIIGPTPNLLRGGKHPPGRLVSTAATLGPQLAESTVTEWLEMTVTNLTTLPMQSTFKQCTGTYPGEFSQGIHYDRWVVGNRALTGIQYAYGKRLFKTSTITFDTFINILNLLCLLALMEQSFAAGIM